ncbi:hypothetical protein diail_10059, partial [Diaporthe ilicicola]
TLVEAASFTAQVPFFNVTAADFDSGDATATETVAGATATATPAASSSSGSGSGGLTNGAIAGIAVGTNAPSSAPWPSLAPLRSCCSGEEGLHLVRLLVLPGLRCPRRRGR